MGIVNLKQCGLAWLMALNMQSLADIARDEAERRNRLDEQGIVAKVIDGNASGSGRQANLTTSSEPDIKAKEAPVPPRSEKGSSSARTYRSALQKLDRAIQKTELRLKSVRARMQAAKQADSKSLGVPGRGGKREQQSQLQIEIDELQIELKQLRQERLEIYDSGRKAGFMPGELEGKGIVP